MTEQQSKRLRIGDRVRDKFGRLGTVTYRDGAVVEITWDGDKTLLAHWQAPDFGINSAPSEATT